MVQNGAWRLSSFEKSQVPGDDVLMLRFLVLFVVSETVCRAKWHKLPEVVLWCRTFQCGFGQQKVNQLEFGACATKPTVIGGNTVPLPGRKGQGRDIAGISK